jgi:hypothetical protein
VVHRRRGRAQDAVDGGPARQDRRGAAGGHCRRGGALQLDAFELLLLVVAVVQVVDVALADE